MQRIFGIALICGLIWLGVTLFTEGTDGLLRWLPGRESAPSAASRESTSTPLEDMRARGEELRQQQLDRMERQLGPPPDPD